MTEQELICFLTVDCHHCSPALRRVPFHLGCRRISDADYQRVHYRWTVLSEVEETEHPQTV